MSRTKCSIKGCSNPYRRVEKGNSITKEGKELLARKRFVPARCFQKTYFRYCENCYGNVDETKETNWIKFKDNNYLAIDVYRKQWRY